MSTTKRERCFSLPLSTFESEITDTYTLFQMNMHQAEDENQSKLAQVPHSFSRNYSFCGRGVFLAASVNDERFCACSPLK